MLKSFLSDKGVSPAPLAVFRIGFGVMMLLSVVRFWYHGWIEKLYLEPAYFFSYRYFQWVKPIGNWTYLIFLLIGFSAVAIALGWKYRAATVLFFLSFTYVELMDKTTYLNHYYFVSLLSFLLIFLPANRYFSLDARGLAGRSVPKWSIGILQLFVGVVYFYAGLAKLNSDWLLHAQPLSIWLPAKYDIPLLGSFLQDRWVHYAFAWSGAAYDLLIPFLLFWKPTRNLAFVAVVIFHVLTRVLFPIGMFPYIMIVSALIFFDARVHERILGVIRKLIRARPPVECRESGKEFRRPGAKTIALALLVLHLLVPWRHLLNEGELFWTEEGYRFSWRVMLMEKAGYLTYTLEDPITRKRRTVDPSGYLSTFQNKQVATQPDFILEFAHYLADLEAEKTGTRPSVYAESYVALNGRRSQPYIRAEIDLTTIHPSTPRTQWLMPFEDDIYGL